LFKYIENKNKDQEIYGAFKKSVKMAKKQFLQKRIYGRAIRKRPILLMDYQEDDVS
jgi:hypothetical protein